MSNQFFTENVSTGAHVTNVNGDHVSNPTYNISTHTTTCTMNVYFINITAGTTADSNFANAWGAAQAGPGPRLSVMSMNTSPPDVAAGTALTPDSQNSGIQKTLLEKMGEITQQISTFTHDMRRIVGHVWATPGRAPIGNPRNSAQMVWLARSSAQMALLGSRGR